jgi:gluconolactonase
MNRSICKLPQTDRMGASGFLGRLRIVLVLCVVATGSALAGTPFDPIYADGFEPVCGVIAYSESFAQANGAAWPAPWSVAGGIALADIQSGRARLRPTPSGYSLARMKAAIVNRDVEVRFAFVMEDEPTQGVGFYVRQNGGYLTQTVPNGQGYAVFLEGGFRAQPGIGLWKEQAGVESPLAHSAGSVAGPSAGVLYRVRFRVHQLNATSTYMQAKFWADASAEPVGWQVSVTDSTAVLQNIDGGIAIDSWSVTQNPNPISAHTVVDDIQIESLCNPIVALSAPVAVSETFVFTEGPVWRGNHLLFSDIDGNTIYRLDPPSAISVFRNPSDRSNGLALDIAGNLLAGEHTTRRVSITDATSGVRSTLVSLYQGMRFNSPNDMDVRADGTLYFTDPDYGLSNPPTQRELPFNGLFRRRPDGALILEWAGTVGVNEPNGATLSPNADYLYVSDSQQGNLHRWDVASDGALSNDRVLATGLSTPDGMCMDLRGNIYVATSNAIQIFAADGARWGSVAIPRAASNCAFGDSDGRSLYVTARQSLYRVR